MIIKANSHSESNVAGTLIIMLLQTQYSAFVTSFQKCPVVWFLPYFVSLMLS